MGGAASVVRAGPVKTLMKAFHDKGTVGTSGGESKHEASERCGHGRYIDKGFDLPAFVVWHVHFWSLMMRVLFACFTRAV
jgi:hypothetical protein